MAEKILVVDDEEGIRNLFYEVLTDNGYTVRLAADGEAALSLLEEEEIEIIFLDLKLFGMNGIELCRRIKGKNPLSIIYAMTGWVVLFEVEECRQVGFDDYFVKPISAETITKAVAEATEKLIRWKRRYNHLPQ